MNDEQKIYHIAERTSILDIPVTATICMTAFSAFDVASHMVPAIGETPVLGGLLLTGFTLITGAKLGSVQRVMNSIKQMEIMRDPASYPLEHAERVFIDDVDGLACLMEKTSAKEANEWGTLLKTFPENDNASIREILDYEEATNFIKKTGKNCIRFNFKKVKNSGYNGIHHYHPAYDKNDMRLNVGNFYVSYVDRHHSINEIHLLTFNLSDGPEIVGYNKQFTYIPAVDDKTELMRADSKEIMRYLKKFSQKTQESP